MELSGDQAGWLADGRSARMKHDLGPLYAMAAALVCAAASWYLLKELGPLLRPLTLAVFLAYTVLPVQRSLRRRVPAIVAGPLLALLVAAAILGLAYLLYGNLVDLKAELPHLIERSRELITQLRTWGRDRLPAWVLAPAPDGARDRGGDLHEVQGPGFHSGQHGGRLPDRGPDRRVVFAVPAARGSSFSRAGPGEHSAGTG